MTRPLRCVVIVALLHLPSGAAAQVFRVEQLNTTQIAALDRQKTAVVLWGGILEEHGPYLPAFTDGYMNEYLARRVAERIAARPGWSVLLFPPVPLGAETAEGIGGLRHFPGSYGVRAETLQAVFDDLASAIGQQGFRWVFLIHGHGAPANSRALDAVSERFHQRFSGRMVHLSGMPEVRRKCAAVVERRLPAAAVAEDARSLHAGAWETSVLLALRPDLVDPAYRRARPLPADGLGPSAEIARQPGWPGYFGSPRLATRAIGQECLEAMGAAYTSAALRALDDQSALR